MISRQRQEHYESFANNFAKTIITQNFTAAYQMLAPWLQTEMPQDDLRAEFENELLTMNDYWDIEELIYPADFKVSSNSSSLADLQAERNWREPRKFSDELTNENFRQWMVIQFLPDEDDERIEFDGWFDFWMVVAEISGQLKIGYFEFAEVD